MNNKERKRGWKNGNADGCKSLARILQDKGPYRTVVPGRQRTVKGLTGPRKWSPHSPFSIISVLSYMPLGKVGLVAGQIRKGKLRG